MSSYSTNLRIELIDNGSQSGQWGNTTNTNLGTLIEQAISGYVEYACTGGTDTIDIPDGATGVARNMYIELTGTGGGTLQVPTNRKLYFIYNNTDSGAVTVKVSGQTGVSITNGNRVVLACDGTDVVPAVTYIPFNDVDVNTLTATNLTATNLTVTNVTLGNFLLDISGGSISFTSTLTYTASVSSTTMTVTAVTLGDVLYGQTISGTGITTGTTVGAQLTSTETAAATPTFAEGGAIGDTSFSVDSVSGVAIGQMISGTGIPTGTYVGSITGVVIGLVDRDNVAVAFTVQAAGTYTVAATKGKGTYTVSISQAALSTTITAIKRVATLSGTGALTALGTISSNAALSG